MCPEHDAVTQSGEIHGLLPTPLLLLVQAFPWSPYKTCSKLLKLNSPCKSKTQTGKGGEKNSSKGKDSTRRRGSSIPLLRGKNAQITYLILNIISFPASVPAGIEMGMEKLGWESCQLWIARISQANPVFAQNLWGKWEWYLCTSLFCHSHASCAVLQILGVGPGDLDTQLEGSDWF